MSLIIQSALKLNESLSAAGVKFNLEASVVQPDCQQISLHADRETIKAVAASLRAKGFNTDASSDSKTLVLSKTVRNNTAIVAFSAEGRGFSITAAAPEARVAFAVKQYGPKLEQAIKKDHSAAEAKLRDADATAVATYLGENYDPTPKGVYIAWLCKMYSTGNAFKIAEDAFAIKKALVAFEKFKPKMEKRDINQYTSVGELKDAASPFYTEKTKGDEDREVRGQVDTVINSQNFSVVIPKTEAASCAIGKGTDGCTAATSGEGPNQFSNYNSKGPLYIIRLKDHSGKVRKFQLRYETDSFMDEKDQPVSKSDIALLSSFKEYADFLNLLIEKHYGEYLKD
jgi:hypothetical protein